jgi:hypothetical protein
VMGDSGRYECHLSNDMGSTTGVCNVEVTKHQLRNHVEIFNEQIG